jgi:hypothetical protein
MAREQSPRTSVSLSRRESGHSNRPWEVLFKGSFQTYITPSKPARHLSRRPYSFALSILAAAETGSACAGDKHPVWGCRSAQAAGRRACGNSGRVASSSSSCKLTVFVRAAQGLGAARGISHSRSARCHPPQEPTIRVYRSGSRQASGEYMRS